MRAAVFYGPGSIANEEVDCDFRYDPIEPKRSYGRTEGDIFLQ